MFTQKKGKFKKQGAVSQRRDLEFFVLAEARFNASCNIELAWARETPAVPNTTKPRFQIAQDHRCINFFSVDLGESHTLAISSGASDRTRFGRSATLDQFTKRLLDAAQTLFARNRKSELVIFTVKERRH